MLDVCATLGFRFEEDDDEAVSAWLSDVLVNEVVHHVADQRYSCVVLNV